MLGLWLRMASYVNAEGFTIPSSQVDYNANGDVGDVVYPIHGGVLQADGTWTALVSIAACDEYDRVYDYIWKSGQAFIGWAAACAVLFFGKHALAIFRGLR